MRRWRARNADPESALQLPALDFRCSEQGAMFVVARIAGQQMFVVLDPLASTVEEERGWTDGASLRVIRRFVVDHQADVSCEKATSQREQKKLSACECFLNSELSCKARQLTGAEPRTAVE